MWVDLAYCQRSQWFLMCLNEFVVEVEALTCVTNHCSLSLWDREALIGPGENVHCRHELYLRFMWVNDDNFTRAVTVRHKGDFFFFLHSLVLT